MVGEMFRRRSRRYSGLMPVPVRVPVLVLVLMLVLVDLVLVQSGPESDPYQTLGVTRSASQSDIKKAYKHLAREWYVVLVLPLGDMSPCHHVTMSSCHHVTMSLCRHVTMSSMHVERPPHGCWLLWLQCMGSGCRWCECSAWGLGVGGVSAVHGVWV